MQLLFGNPGNDRPAVFDIERDFRSVFYFIREFSIVSETVLRIIKYIISLLNSKESIPRRKVLVYIGVEFSG